MSRLSEIRQLFHKLGLICACCDGRRDLDGWKCCQDCVKDQGRARGPVQGTIQTSAWYSIFYIFSCHSKIEVCHPHQGCQGEGAAEVPLKEKWGDNSWAFSKLEIPIGSKLLCAQVLKQCDVLSLETTLDVNDTSLHARKVTRARLDRPH